VGQVEPHIEREASWVAGTIAIGHTTFCKFI